MQPKGPEPTGPVSYGTLPCSPHVLEVWLRSFCESREGNLPGADGEKHLQRVSLQRRALGWQDEPLSEATKCFRNAIQSRLWTLLSQCGLCNCRAPARHWPSTRALSPVSVGVSYKKKHKYWTPALRRLKALRFAPEHRRPMEMKLSSDICWLELNNISDDIKNTSRSVGAKLRSNVITHNTSTLLIFHHTRTARRQPVSSKLPHSPRASDLNSGLISPTPLMGRCLLQTPRSKRMDCNYQDCRWIQIRESSYRTGFTPDCVFWLS